MSPPTTFTPTHHDLISSHRAYPTHSSRKLDTLLGENPLLESGSRPSFHPASGAARDADAGSWLAPADDDSDAVSIKSTSSSASSIRFVKSTPPKATLRPLLRLTSPRPHFTASVVSPRFPEYSPVTPVFVVDKRKKMGKLTRTLGSNVPPELVFSQTADAKMLPSKTVVPSLLSALAPAHERELVKMKAQRARQSQSSRPTREAGLSPYAYSTSEHSGSRSTTSFQSASSGSASSPNSPYTPFSASWTSPSHSAPPRSPHYVKTSTWNTAPSVREVHHGHGGSKPSPPAVRPSTSSRSTDENRYFSRHFDVAVPPYAAPVRSASPFRSVSPFPRSSTSASNHSRGGDTEYEEDAYIDTHRKEAGWSGEWSGAHGMGEVVNKLRRLRFK
ncbi:hypothetical protein C8F04DRAFT_1107237 [Mycena alexandri]|uniref:Uncharacterized protein n=1 Tax=Mycena alexandri TaxID=1745969 RepID=A0AAD6SR74_9AGAR|nr:hypothetical protein C8F04DRAFT_1107237 [Mycena alexandri]